MKKLGILALFFYGIHGGYHLYHGRPEDLLWACHLGAALIGAGLLVPSLALSGVGTLFLCMGTPLWLLDLASGGEFMPTSCFTHLGGLSIGLYAVRQYGFPRGVWWKAIAGLLALIVLSRLLTPAAANVNVAFAIQPGYEEKFPSHSAYLATMIILAGAYFRFAEYLLRRWLQRHPTGEEGS